MNTKPQLIAPHGGYRKLKTFQLAELIYDVTARFCDKYVDRRSRTHDQMVQAARSGRQNIAEGSVDSATSKKMEMKLAGVAKGSLEELRLDYEDFLRQRDLPKWEPNHPALKRFKARRCATMDEFRTWVAEEINHAKQNTDKEDNTDEHGLTRKMKKGKSNMVRASLCSSVSPRVLAANGMLSLLNLCIYLLDRQLKSQAAAFEKEGGFTERLYKLRRQARETG